MAPAGDSRWETVASEEVFAARPWIRVLREDVRLANGTRIRDFYRIEVPEHVVIVAVTAAGGVVLAEQYKHGTGAVHVGFPAGYIDDDEDPLATAKRELLEETGYASDRWRSLGAFTIDGNRGCGRAHVFLAEEATKQADVMPSPTEPLTVRVASPREAEKSLLDGRMGVASHALAFLLADRSGAFRHGE